MDVLCGPFSKRGARRASRPENATCTALRPQTKTVTQQAELRWFLWDTWEAPKPPQEQRNNEERALKHAQKTHFAARKRRPRGGGPPPKHQNERRRSHAQTRSAPEDTATAPTQPRRKQRHTHTRTQRHGHRRRQRHGSHTCKQQRRCETMRRHVYGYDSLFFREGNGQSNVNANAEANTNADPRKRKRAVRFFCNARGAADGVRASVGRQAHHETGAASEAALAHQDQRTPWRRPQGRDPLRDFTPCAIFAQPSKVPVVFHHAFLGRTTRCHVPVAADAMSTKGTGMFPANVAPLDSHCSRQSWAAAARAARWAGGS